MADRAPQWVFVLEAAGGDPLRAQQMEAELSREWWDRWCVFRQERVRAKKK